MKYLLIVSLFALSFQPFNATAYQLREVQYVEWSPVGNTIAVGSFDTIWLYDIDQQIISQANISTYLASMSWNRDGSKLATLDVDTLNNGRWSLEIRDSATLKVISTIEEENETLIYPQAVWSPKGDKIAVSIGTAIKIIDTLSNQIVRSMVTTNFEASSLAWSPDGDAIATPSGRELIIWDANSGNIVKRFSDGDFFTKFAWNSDGELFAILRGNATVSDITIWNHATYEIVTTLRGDDTITDFAWYGNKLASSSAGGVIKIWDIDHDQLLREIFITERVNSISWNPDGTQLAYGGQNGEFWVVDVESAD